jgi:hypothetical protein
MDSEARLAPARKRDRSTLPSLALVVGCILFAYGFKSGNSFVQWVLPAVLMLGALGYGFWSGRSSGEPGQGS